RYRPEIVYLPISQGLLGYIRDSLFMLVSKIGKVKIVLHLRGAYFNSFYEESFFLTRWWIRTSLIWADRMIVLGQSLRSLFDGLLPAEKIRVVPNGLSIADFEQAQIESRTEEPIQLCFISNLDRTKGYWVLLEALVKLSRYHKLRCTFAGAWLSETDKNEA